MGEGRRAVLVTGASRGIGAAVARAFAARGERVAVHFSANEARAREVLASLDGDGHVLAGADLRDAEATRGMVSEAVAGLGGAAGGGNNPGGLRGPPITRP